MERILVLEDSKDYQLLIREALRAHFEVEFCETVSDALTAIKCKPYNLFLLDVVLPESSGLEVCSFIKSQEHLRHIPTILLTSKDNINDKLKGFQYGADDYITKPFDFRELVARVNVHTQKNKNKKETYILSHGYIVHITKQEVVDPNKNHIDLTRIEFKLLKYLCENLDRVLSREMILNHAWPENLNISQRTVDTHISNLRKKTGELGKNIKSVHGMGYKMCS